MNSVVNVPGGTAFSSRIKKPEFRMGGKTGTAQVRRISMQERETRVLKNKELPWKERDHALFVGYAPFENPKYAVSVIVDHGGSGSASAAPIARDLILAAQYDSTPPLSSYPEAQRNRINSKLKKMRLLDPKETMGL